MPELIGTVLAKTGLKAAGELAKEFACKLVGPAAEELGLTLQDRLHVFRVRQQVRLLARSQEMLVEAGVAPRSVPLKVLAPLLDGATLEEEEDERMRERWAALLANAASAPDNHIPPGFPHILREMDERDALVLEGLSKSGGTHPNHHRPIGTKWHEKPAGMPAEDVGALLLPGERFGPLRPIPKESREAALVALANLERLGLIESEVAQSLELRPNRYRRDEMEIRPGQRSGEKFVRLTALGVRFLKACAPPSPSREA